MYMYMICLIFENVVMFKLIFVMFFIICMLLKDMFIIIDGKICIENVWKV